MKTTAEPFLGGLFTEKLARGGLVRVLDLFGLGVGSGCFSIS